MMKQISIVLLGMTLLITFSYSKENEIKLDSSDKFADLDTNQPVERAIRTATNQFRHEVLKEHNIYRKRHCAPPLKLDEDLNKGAEAQAKKIAEMDSMKNMKHTTASVGENLFASKNQKLIGKRPTDDWYNEVEHYDFEHGAYSSTTGHFTQLVWKGSQRLGVGSAISESGTTYVVAQYAPEGNFPGRFEQNVLSSECSHK